MAAEDFAKSAVERLSEDESLRGDLSDIGFGPLLDWATAAATAYSKQAKDQAAMDTYTDQLRGVVQEAVSVAQNGKLDQVKALLDFEVADPAKATADLQALKLSDDADDNAVKIAAVLQAALNTPKSTVSNSNQPEASSPVTPAPTNPNTAKTTDQPLKNKSGGLLSAPSRFFNSVNTRLKNRNRRPR